MIVLEIILMMIVIGLLIMAVTFLWGIQTFIESIVESISNGITKILDFVAKPVLLLYEKIRDWVVDLLSPLFYHLPITKFADRFDAFGSATSVRLFLVALIYVTVVLVVCATQGTLETFLEDMFFIMPFGFFLELLKGGVSFDLVNMISAGFTGFITMMLFRKCMGDLIDDTGFGNFVLRIVYYLVLTVAACSLCVHLSGVWQFASNILVSVVTMVSGEMGGLDSDFLGILAMIGLGIALLLLLYFVLLIMLVSLREFVSIIGYSIFSVLLMLILVLACYAILSESFLNSPEGSVITDILVLIVLFYPDFRRVNSDLEY